LKIAKAVKLSRPGQHRSASVTRTCTFVPEHEAMSKFVLWCRSGSDGLGEF
jgi:hypothetical protein